MTENPDMIEKNQTEKKKKSLPEPVSAAFFHVSLI